MTLRDVGHVQVSCGAAPGIVFRDWKQDVSGRRLGKALGKVAGRVPW